ncbi:hypothetical protein HYPSUDRAFT_49590 [Hypholoma sublateritium FD-334 SS-4]|uniref:ribonuclease H n=1 Tax=Hypholoma sublateritium (strain FD-334 SS-4) TaxID=945553 RepID=A0A0D2KGX6_HYPSF|nr:hypothetical protein HYPSUDRAFT_49590 [Hypholoma sublateritium FD-334 SS-4]
MIILRHYYDPALPDYPRMHELNLSLPDNYQRAPPIPSYVGGRSYPAYPSQNPLKIFKPMFNAHLYPEPRWVELDAAPGGTKHAVLVFTDGAAPNNGQLSVRAGCGILVRPDGRHGVSFPLERVSGESLTSNRAELRAAHAALGLRDWRAEGFGKVVIASDSEYVVLGAVQRAAIWEQNGWINTRGQEVPNKDLWIMLIQAIRKLEREGTVVQFYRINREFNLADGLAKQGANVAEVPTRWIKQT